jgi:hypothetical protein
MKQWYKKEDGAKSLLIFVGTDYDWAKDNGFTEGECVQSLSDGAWYLEEEYTQDLREADVRLVRNDYLLATDMYVSIPDYPITAEERALYIDYRKYLRDYTKTENWYMSLPKTFEEWLPHPVVEEKVDIVD